MTHRPHYFHEDDLGAFGDIAKDAPELAKASNALAPAQRLSHLIVTQFTDALSVPPTNHFAKGACDQSSTWSKSCSHVT